MDAHVGTHVDTPHHVHTPGAAPPEPPLDAFVGPACVLDLRGRAAIGREDLEAAGAALDAPRVLLRTHDGERWDAPPAPEASAGLDEEAAEWLVARGARLVGIDASSIQSRCATDRTHLALLSAGVAVVEGLDLRHAPPGPYDLLCLPVRIPGCDGLPARAVLAPRGTIQ